MTKLDQNRIEMPCDYDSLLAAWELVKTRGSASGVDGVSVEAFAMDSGRRLHELSGRLAQRKYTPAPLRRFAIPKNDGGVRVLAIPTVSDRVVQRAALTAMEPLLEACFLSSSYAYRNGRSVKQAVQRVSALRGEGYEWIAHIDIRDCFDSIDWRILMSRLSPLAAPYLKLLIRKWISAPGIGYDWIEPVRGIPQGGVISPSLCNLVLTDLDAAMYRAGIPSVRYADDCILFAKSEREARAFLLAAADVLRDLHLEPNAEKSEVTSFETGFRFLGTLFVQSVVLPYVRIKTDSGQTHYISGYQGARRRNRKVRVYRGKGHICVVGNLPKRDIERLVAEAMTDELQGKSSPVGRALMDAWKKELTRSVHPLAKRQVTAESVALI